MTMTTAFRVASLIALGTAPCLFFSSCSTKGRVERRYAADAYGSVAVYPTHARDANPRFVAYGDTQSGWRVNEKFLRRENWITAKAFIFPFFQVYTIVQGMVGGVNYLRHHPDYGGVERRLVRDVVYERIQRGDIDFVLNLGDICANDGRRPAHWKVFYEENLEDVPLAREVPYVTTPGNHDRANDGRDGVPNYRAAFPYPQFFVLSYPDLAIFIIDSNVILDQYQAIPDDEQEALFERWICSGIADEPSWLERELAGAPQRFKIVAMHHPPVSVGRHYNDWDRPDWGTDLSGKRRRFLDVLLDGGVQVVMSGHEHNYQHIEVRRGSARKLDVIVSSGGGAPIRALPGDEEIATRCRAFQDQGIDVNVVARAETHHYTIVEVAGDVLRFSTVAAGDGTPVETVTVRAGGRP